MDSLERFQKACDGLDVDRPPVWMMRQAGRALPEYRQLREKHSFWEMVTTPELACEVTLQPVRRFPLDAAILFSDILVVPAAMGVDIKFDPAPVLSPTIRTAEDLKALRHPDVHDALGYVSAAIRRIRDSIGKTHAVLGFSGAPFTLACYMIDGVGNKGFPQTKAMMYSSPELLHDLLDLVASVVRAYVVLQVTAGVTALQLFDTWAGELSRDEYEEFALPYVTRVLKAVDDVPSIYYINGVSALVEQAASSGAQVLGVDWRVPLAEVRNRTWETLVLQGNLDPAALFAPRDVIRRKVFNMLDQTRGEGHIVNLGHGLMPDTPLEGIEAFVDAVNAYSMGGK